MLTYYDLLPTPKQISRIKELSTTFALIESKKKLGDYLLSEGAYPKVTNQGFLEKISWVKARNKASFDMPCFCCNKIGDIQMHHIRHVRKRSYVLIPETSTWEQIMNLRNRLQIPVCPECHRKIHNGLFDGPSLKKFRDNRIVHVESFVKPGKVYHAKSLIEKGWSQVVPRP